VYGDVRSNVELVFRVGQSDRMVAGTGTERTYVYAFAELIKQTTNDSLRQAGSQAESVLAELLPAEAS
jgi:hypothetical protein